MKTPLKILFASCDGDVTAAVLERLARAYRPEFVPVATWQELRQELHAGDFQLIFVAATAALSPDTLLAERSLAGKETPIFVLCNAATEDMALEAVRVGAEEAIRVDDLRRLVPAVARELRTADRRCSQPSEGRDESQLQWATSALLHLARTRLFLGDNLINDLREITEVAGRALVVARSSVWLYDGAHSKMRCIDLYDRQTGTHRDGATLSLLDHPAYFLALEQQRLLVADDARSDPRLRAYADDYLTPLGVTSLVDAAVRSHEEMKGVICLEHIGPPRGWTAEEELFATALADLVALALEASERYSVEAALRDAERHFLELFEHTSDAVAIFAARGDGNWICETMNPACETATGLSAADCFGRNACDFVPSGVPEALATAFSECRSGKEVVAREHPLALRAGQRWFNTVLVPLTDRHGAVRRMACIARDITDHRITEDRLRASEQRLMLHIRETPLGAIEWDLAGRVVSWNPSAERIFGYREREAMNRNLNFIIPVDIRPYTDATWAALIAQRGGTRSTNRNVRKDGVFIDCEWYNTPLIDEQGKTIGVASLVHDVTEHRRNEEAIRRLNMELEQRVSERTAQLAAANKELEAFSYSVSHDLRAPLRSIDGFSKALLEDCLDRLDLDGQDYLKRVRAASQRMGDLIDDLLNLSRINRAELRRTRVDLGLIARQIANGLHTAHPKRDIDWSITLSLVAHGDKNLLTILMENLLSNAFKYTGRQPRARIEFGSMSEKPPITYYVKDDGAGFDMAHADKLFQPFQRLHHADEFAGHGIGLATVQRIIHRHGGRIWAESSVAGGACFFFTLDEPPTGDAPLE